MLDSHEDGKTIIKKEDIDSFRKLFPIGSKVFVTGYGDVLTRPGGYYDGKSYNIKVSFVATGGFGFLSADIIRRSGKLV